MDAFNLRLLATVLGVAAVVSTPIAAESGQSTGEHKLVKAPPGFTDSCRRYSWFCANRDDGTAAPADVLDLAEKVNRRVNGSVRELTDAENYGTADYWTLPDNGSGDCEDFVLLKYKLLIEAGVPSQDLAIAIALDRYGDNHAVLILRHASGDLVLDNLVSRILPWNQTDYTFLAMQMSGDKSQWEVVVNQPRDSNVLAHR